MQKTLTIKVPDELWVNKFEKNQTKTYEYDGPESFWISIKDEHIALTAFEDEPTIIQSTENKHFIDIANASEVELACAIMIVHGAESYEFVYSDKVNHDGSIYKEISNPRLEDYYSAKFIEGKIVLQVITKDPTLQNEIIARERRDYVLKYFNTFDFDEEDRAKIQNFLEKINTYLESMRNVYPWKYIEIDKNEIPKIPTSLIQVFNTLPELN